MNKKQLEREIKKQERRIKKAERDKDYTLVELHKNRLYQLKNRLETGIYDRTKVGTWTE